MGLGRTVQVCGVDHAADVQAKGWFPVHLRVHAEDVVQHGSRQHVAGGAVGDDGALLEHDHSVGEPRRELEIVDGHECGAARAHVIAHELEERVGVGEVELVDALTISGRGSVDQTAIWLDLSQDVVGDRPVFKGRVKFPRLQPAGLQSLGKLASLVPDSPEGDEAQPAATTGPNLDAELEVTASLLDSDAAAQGSFEGKLVYRDNKATIDPLALTYLGGEAAQISLQISDKTARVFQGMLLFFVLASDTLIHYRIRLVRTAPAGETGNA